MSIYHPDKWVVIKIVLEDETLYKVLGTWLGGYLNGDSWRLNSGIERVELDGEYLLFHGYSGSIYRCHKDSWGTSSYTSGVLRGFLEQEERILLLDSETDWSALEV